MNTAPGMKPTPSGGITSMEMKLGGPRGRSVDDYEGNKFNSSRAAADMRSNVGSGPVEYDTNMPATVQSNTTAELGMGSPYGVSETAHAGHDFRAGRHSSHGDYQRYGNKPHTPQSFFGSPIQMDLTTGIWAIVLLLIIMLVFKK